jgi:O-antigen/teichoic acid export membrane protein
MRPFHTSRLPRFVAMRRAPPGTIAALVIRIAAAGLAFGSQVLLARWMGSFAFGIYSSIAVAFTVAGTLSAAGFGSAALRFVPAYLETGAESFARGFIRTGCLVAIALGLAIAVLAGVAVVRVPDALDVGYGPPLLIAATALPAYAITDVLDGVARSRRWMVLALAPPYLARPIGLVAIAAAMAASRTLDAATAAAALAASTFAAAVLQWLVIRHRLRPLWSEGPRFAPRDWLRATLPLAAFEGLALLASNLDVLLLSLWRTPEEVAFYFAAARTVSLLGFVTFAVGAAATSRFSALHAAGQQAHVAQLLGETRRWCLWPTLLGAAAMIAVGPAVLGLFGSSFEESYGPLVVLAVGWLLRSSAGAAQGFLIATGRQAIVMGVQVAATSIAVGLGIALIPGHGAIGAATAGAATFAFEGLALRRAARRALRAT